MFGVWQFYFYLFIYILKYQCHYILKCLFSISGSRSHGSTVGSWSSFPHVSVFHHKWLLLSHNGDLLSVLLCHICTCHLFGCFVFFSQGINKFKGKKTVRALCIVPTVNAVQQVFFQLVFTSTLTHTVQVLPPNQSIHNIEYL